MLQEIECPHPPLIENAISNYVERYVGSRVNYVCANGYEMRGADITGSAYLTCGKDKKWSGTMNFKCVCKFVSKEPKKTGFNTLILICNIEKSRIGG